MNPLELKRKTEESRSLLAQAKALSDLRTTEKRSWTAEEKNKFETIVSAAETINQEVEEESRMNRLEKQLAPNDTKDVRKSNDKDVNDAFKTFLRFGKDSLNQEQRQAMAEHRTISSIGSGVTGAGNEFVPYSFADKYVTYLKYAGGVFDVANVITTDSGQPYQIPVVDDTGNNGEVLAENSSVLDNHTNDPVTSRDTLNAYMFDSGVIRCSIQLLADSGFDVEDWVGTNLFKRIARRSNDKFTNGAGTTEPTGFLGTAQVGVTGASATAVTFAELNTLLNKLDWSYQQQGEARWMFHQNTLATLRGLVDSNNRPVWNAEYGNVALGAPATFLGLPYTINNAMPVLGALNKSIAVGNFKNVWVRQVKGLDMVRLEERYMDTLQKGFIAFGRYDSILTIPASIQVFQNLHS